MVIRLVSGTTPCHDWRWNRVSAGETRTHSVCVREKEQHAARTTVETARETGRQDNKQCTRGNRNGAEGRRVEERGKRGGERFMDMVLQIIAVHAISLQDAAASSFRFVYLSVRLANLAIVTPTQTHGMDRQASRKAEDAQRCIQRIS